MTNRPPAHTATLAALALLAACAGDDTTDYTVAREYWSHPDSVMVGLGQLTDVKALSRENVWVADLMAGAIYSIAPGEGRYVGIGMGENEPTEVRTPAKIALSREYGLAAFDGETRMVDLFTLEGEHIRGFEPGFVPAVMEFSRQPVGLTFGVAAEDSAGVRRSVVIRTGLRGEERDTLLSPSHGPETLRPSVARPGETSMAASSTGMWVWSRLAPDTIFELSPGGVRRLLVRPADTTAVAILSDRERDMLWLVHPDTLVRRYSAYDARLAAPEGEDPAPGSLAYLGERTTPEGFGPAAVHDGIIMGVRRGPRGLRMMAYDLNADRFARPEAEAR